MKMCKRWHDRTVLWANRNFDVVSDVLTPEEARDAELKLRAADFTFSYQVVRNLDDRNQAVVLRYRS